MAQQKSLNIGLIGYGFMGRAHSNAYKRVNHFFDLEYRPVPRPSAPQAGARHSPNKWGYESVETDWRKLIARKDIDAIDICTPNNSHAEIAIAAAEAGKMILCEKPLAMNGRRLEDGGRRGTGRGPEHGLVQLSPGAGRDSRQGIDRRGPAGQDLHYRAKFLQDWTIWADFRRAAGRWRWMWRRPDRVSPATCWPTASTRPFRSTARSLGSAP